MKKIFQHITVVCMIAIVMVASVGFSACCLFGCHGDMRGEANKEDYCCEEVVAKQFPNQTSKECPDCNDEYVNLDVDYLGSSIDFKISDPSSFTPQSIVYSTEIIFTQQAILLWELNLPPPPHGKTLLPHIQSFLC